MRSIEQLIREALELRQKAIAENPSPWPEFRVCAEEYALMQNEHPDLQRIFEMPDRLCGMRVAVV